MENDFKSIKNKSTLWNIMIENGIFNGIDDKYFIEVRTFFEKKNKSNFYKYITCGLVNYS